jgi:acyl carrier protein
MTDIDRRVRKVLRDALALNASDQEIAGVQRADDLLGLDSIATIEFALALEREFGITFDPESLDPEVFADLSRLCAHIAARLREGR